MNIQACMILIANIPTPFKHEPLPEAARVLSMLMHVLQQMNLKICMKHFLNIFANKVENVINGRLMTRRGWFVKSAKKCK